MTASHEATAPGGPRPPLVEVARALEDDARLDGAVDALRPLAQALVADDARRDLLLGRQMGHALHPLMTDAPIGAWMSAVVLDLVGGEGSRDAARRLVGIGVLSALPTALTGLAELAHTDRRTARVGAAHAAGNSVALGLFSASWLARRRGHHTKGVSLGLAGAAAVTVSGFLGAHLAIARNVGSRDAAFAESLPPDQRFGPDAPADAVVA
ncbi:DUF2231 domain-containing protein [Actinotalea ferrariae]|uniref:DUF2231 domain-containing protein n=1 Tax=Actinotalea ferrariae TaxID=1386098 RepID=UPI001C8C8795|nr:DUF2231 domain-containing protein [Actinotalea ferrariae]MBX9243883.1 DUF2231 domain-containing protein [Actinotalea ferrariae]